MRTEKMKLSKIIPYHRNPRKNEKAVEAVIKSIEKYGYVTPIIVDKKNVIIVGHSRYQALARLNYDEVDVIVSDLPASKAKEFRIIDNKTSEFATWDNDKLLAELREFEFNDDFKEMFPFLEFNDTFVDDSKPVTNEDIKNTGVRLENQFTNNSSSSNDLSRIKKIICPHCSGEIEIYS
jgi:hypothetical protein